MAQEKKGSDSAPTESEPQRNSNSPNQILPENVDTKQVEILCISSVENRGPLRAFANIRLGDLFINDCRIIQENDKKPWFSLPVLTYKTRYGTIQYRPLVQILDEQLKNQISEAVLTAWENYERREKNGSSPVK